jgi:hypothetical protein
MELYCKRCKRHWEDTFFLNEDVKSGSIIFDSFVQLTRGHIRLRFFHVCDDGDRAIFDLSISLQQTLNIQLDCTHDKDRLYLL